VLLAPAISEHKGGWGLPDIPVFFLPYVLGYFMTNETYGSDLICE